MIQLLENLKQIATDLSRITYEAECMLAAGRLFRLIESFQDRLNSVPGAVVTICDGLPIGVPELLLALKEVLEYRVTKDIEDGWHFQRQEAYEKADLLIREYKKWEAN